MTSSLMGVEDEARDPVPLFLAFGNVLPPFESGATVSFAAVCSCDIVASRTLSLGTARTLSRIRRGVKKQLPVGIKLFKTFFNVCF